MSLASTQRTKVMPGSYNFNFETEPFQNMVKSWGASLVGIGDVREGLANEFRHLPLAVSLAVLHPPIAMGIVHTKTVTAYTNSFPAVDTILIKVQKRIVSYLRSLGWKAFAIPPDTDKYDPSFAARLYPLFPHKTAATCAGLGWIGKNGLLVTPEYGARLSWATVLTDAPLTASGKPHTKGRCHNCRRCVDICPAAAITPDEWVRGSRGPKINVDACAERLRENHCTLGAYICGLCVLACPQGGNKNFKVQGPKENGNSVFKQSTDKTRRRLENE